MSVDAPESFDTGEVAPVAATGEFVLGDEVSCAVPSTSSLRFEEDAVARALSHIQSHMPLGAEQRCPVLPGALLVDDFDGDQDLDVVAPSWNAFPAVFEGLGNGKFQQVDTSGYHTEEELHGAGAVDLDGDGFAEMIGVGEGFVAIAKGTGPLTWGPWELVHRHTAYPMPCYSTMTWGDVDEDGDLDIFVSAVDGLPDPDTNRFNSDTLTGGVDLLLLSDDDGWVPRNFEVNTPSTSMLGFFTDIDSDNDLDIWAVTSRPGMFDTYLWRNDGGSNKVPEFTDVFRSHFGDQDAYTMGVDSVDFNGDGVLDYCFSSIGEVLSCVVSTTSQTWFENGENMGLVADPLAFDEYADCAERGEVRPEFWSTWSLDLVDLDNDGYEDAVMSAGHVERIAAGGGRGIVMSPNALWRGGETGFEEQTVGSGITSTADQFGMATADLDGDGYREVLFGAWEAPLEVWNNPCGESSWLSVDLLGPAGNRGGFGARLEAVIGERRVVREMYGMRGLGLSPSEFHIGLGDAEQVDLLRIIWPDGHVDEMENVPGRRHVQVHHPRTLD